MAWTTPRTWSDGELVTAAIMNTHVRDNQLTIGPHLIVRKTVDESVVSNTTLQNDDVLLMSLGATETWMFQCNVIFSSSTTADFKVAFTIPASATIAATAMWNNATASTANIRSWTSSGAANDLQALGITELLFLPIYGIVTTAGTAGSLTLQWAQNTTDATNTTVRANSTLYAVKLA